MLYCIQIICDEAGSSMYSRACSWVLGEGCLYIQGSENPYENNSFLLLSVLGHLYPEFRHNTMEMGEKKILFIDSFYSIQMNSDD